MFSFFTKKRTLFLRHSKYPFRFLFLKPLQNPQSPCSYFPRASLIRPFSTKSNNLPEYQMPSVTWGVVQGRKEKLVSRVIISDYLKTIGIVPDELEELELPSTVDVMRERVEFLQKIGLTIDDINEYPLMLACSVRKNIIPVLGYLEKIGIQRSRLGEFVKNYPQCLHARVLYPAISTPVQRTVSKPSRTRRDRLSIRRLCTFRHHSSITDSPADSDLPRRRTFF